MDQRERIAGQLHDSLAQTLFFLNAELERAIALLGEGRAEEALRPLREAKVGVGFAYQDLRETIEALRSTEWNKPLVPALKNLAANFYRQSGSTSSCASPRSCPSLRRKSASRSSASCRRRSPTSGSSARATTVRLSVEAEEGCLQVLIGDDGAGFDPEEVKAGIGLGEMKRLARAIGGSFSSSSRRGAACTSG